jgi:DNA processing protein
LTIVSGLALGIDEAAHWGALPTLGGTVAFMGTGADLIYPNAHRQLARELATHGALVSEWPLGTPPRRNHFPQRNRLIAALTRGVLVVEAAAQSGSLITARLANEIGRDVYAIPGSIHSALTKGCHRLIKEGAKLVETVTDILDELDWPAPAVASTALGHIENAADNSLSSHRVAHKPTRDAPAVSAPLPSAGPTALTHCSEDAQKALCALGQDRIAPDLLAERSGLNAQRLQAALLELELSGYIVALPCGRVEPLIYNASLNLET